MTDTVNDQWAFPVSYEQTPQPAPAELLLASARIELDPAAEDAADTEVANALYWNQINAPQQERFAAQPAAEEAHVVDARADVHHAISTGPEARAAAATETNAAFVDAAVHRAKAYTASTMTMRTGAVASLDAEVKRRDLELAA